MVFISLFMLWVLFNGKFTWEIAAFGAVISFALAWFTQKFVAPAFTLHAQWRVMRLLPDYLRYARLLLVEIFKANASVIKLILSDRDVVVPKLARFTSPLRTNAGRVMLADSITLTPGTITVHLQGDEYLVHCLDESMEEGLAGSEMEKRLLDLERKSEGGDTHERA